MSHEGVGRPKGRAREADTPRRYRVLLPLAHPLEAEVLLPLAEAFMREWQGRLVVLHVVTVPEDHSLSEAAAQVSRSRQQLERFLSERKHAISQVKTVVRVAREVWEGIWETVEQEKIDVLLLGRPDQGMPTTAVGAQLDRRLAEPPCDIIAVRLAAELAKSADGSPDGNVWRAVNRILLPVRGGPHAALALRVAQALAERNNATITLLHVTGRGARDAEEELLATFGPALRGLKRLTRAVTTVGDVSQAIIEEAGRHQVVVMGASSRQVAPDGWAGPILNAVSEAVNTTLIVVKEHAPAVPLPPETRREMPAARGDRPFAVVVDKWFAENTFHSREFADFERLLALKEQQGVTISLGLPALNEEETVGEVIRTTKSALMDEVPLLDEIVLIDSGSVDYTREIATELGIPVYIHQEVLPAYGIRHGKGEALWKSLYILKGDIIAWIDTDIKNIHPRFVYGILGPLLRDRRIQYVKGFYRRPLKQGDKLVAGGGGRVTELTARPLINLFFPELSGLIQPLSGEYAGRRVALEQLPFFTGYGVETGLLVDMLERFGLQAIAQVDLLRRIHHNQPLPSLSKMSFAIIQVVIRRLEERHKIRLLAEVNKTMNLIRYEPGRFYLEPEEIRERERPPMLDIPEYRRQRGLEPAPLTSDRSPLLSH
jgi:nucleotide-binding universal stress UspA family protein